MHVPSIPQQSSAPLSSFMTHEIHSRISNQQSAPQKLYFRHLAIDVLLASRCTLFYAAVEGKDDGGGDGGGEIFSERIYASFPYFKLSKKRWQKFPRTKVTQTLTANIFDKLSSPTFNSRSLNRYLDTIINAILIKKIFLIHRSIILKFSFPLRQGQKP